MTDGELELEPGVRFPGPTGRAFTVTVTAARASLALASSSSLQARIGRRALPGV
jgi:hypothetical protein